MGVAIAGNTVYAGRPFLNHRNGDLYGGKARVLTQVRDRLTPQDRVLVLGAQNGLVADFAMTNKVASLYRLPSIYDYEPQASLTYAQYFTFMRMGSPLSNVYDWYRPIGPILSRSLQRPLFDLTAARYVIVDESVDTTALSLGTSAPEILRDGPIRVYENEQALPRAFFVPAMARVPEDAVLPMLADGPRRSPRDGAGRRARRDRVDGRRLRQRHRHRHHRPQRSADARDRRPGQRPRLPLPRRPVRPRLDRHGRWRAPPKSCAPTTPSGWSRCPPGAARWCSATEPRSLWIGGLISLFTAVGVVLLCWRDRGASVASGDVAVPPDRASQ
jgi:hypothetical protein